MTAAPTTAGTAPSTRATRKTAAKRTASKKATTRKAAAKKTTTRSTAARKSTERESTARRSAAKRPAAEESTAAKALTPARRTPRFNRLGAAEHAIHKHTVRMTLPVFGPVTLPATEKLAFYAGLAAVAALGIVEWPVVVVISVGHLMAEDQRNRLVRDFGLALEEAV